MNISYLALRSLVLAVFDAFRDFVPMPMYREFDPYIESTIVLSDIRPSQPETPKLRSSPVFSSGAHDNLTLYLATIGHETAQHSTSSLHPAFRLLLTSPIASARATRMLASLVPGPPLPAILLAEVVGWERDYMLAIPPYWRRHLPRVAGNTAHYLLG